LRAVDPPRPEFRAREFDLVLVAMR
jgi:hypothetical protein